MSVIHLVKCSKGFAVECKESFGDDYEMYVSYLLTLRDLTDGSTCKIIPLNFEEYSAIVIGDIK